MSLIMNVGTATGEKCDCGHPLLANPNGHVWCSNIHCISNSRSVYTNLIKSKEKQDGD